MKLLTKRRHRTEVMVGAAAKEFLREHKHGSPLWAAVAHCSCGWLQPTIHGEAAETAAEMHRTRA